MYKSVFYDTIRNYVRDTRYEIFISRDCSIIQTIRNYHKVAVVCEDTVWTLPPFLNLRQSSPFLMEKFELVCIFFLLFLFLEILPEIESSRQVSRRYVHPSADIDIFGRLGRRLAFDEGRTRVFVALLEERITDLVYFQAKYSFPSRNHRTGRCTTVGGCPRDASSFILRLSTLSFPLQAAGAPQLLFFAITIHCPKPFTSRTAAAASAPVHRRLIVRFPVSCAPLVRTPYCWHLI